jgi:hypothetical protein
VDRKRREKEEGGRTTGKLKKNSVKTSRFDSSPTSTFFSSLVTLVLSLFWTNKLVHFLLMPAIIATPGEVLFPEVRCSFLLRHCFDLFSALAHAKGAKRHAEKNYKDAMISNDPAA